MLTNLMVFCAEGLKVPGVKEYAMERAVSLNLPFNLSFLHLINGEKDLDICVRTKTKLYEQHQESR
jgi:hypothetical protein